MSIKGLFNIETMIAAVKVGSLLLIAVAYIGCGKKCQQPIDTPFKTLAGTEWRLVETSDPTVQGLDRFSFLLMSFSINFSGDIKKVEFNELYETPVAIFRWNPVENGYMEIRYSNLGPESDDDEGGSGKILGTEPYSYELNRELNMTNLNNGYSYRYVPFQGVVEPDSTCTF